MVTKFNAYPRLDPGPRKKKLWRTGSVVQPECKLWFAAAKLLQSCPTLCDPIDGSPSGSTIPGILHARALEWVAISFSNAWKWEVKVKSFSPVWLLATPWTAAHRAPPSIGFSRQEYWSVVPLPSPNMLPRLVIVFLTRSKRLLISRLGTVK